MGAAPLLGMVAAGECPRGEEGEAWGGHALGRATGVGIRKLSAVGTERVTGEKEPIRFCDPY